MEVQLFCEGIKSYSGVSEVLFTSFTQNKSSHQTAKNLRIKIKLQGKQ